MLLFYRVVTSRVSECTQCARFPGLEYSCFSQELFLMMFTSWRCASVGAILAVYISPTATSVKLPYCKYKDKKRLAIHGTRKAARGAVMESSMRLPTVVSTLSSNISPLPTKPALVWVLFSKSNQATPVRASPKFISTVLPE